MFYTAEGFLFSLGRKRKNDFEVFYLDMDPSLKILTYNLKVPFTYSLTVETNDPKIAKASTVWEYYVNPISDLEQLIREIESKKYKVINSEESTRKITDLCPQCHRHGIPKIEKKDNADRRVRNSKYGKESTVSKRPVEYWLSYDHKLKPKKCWISQFTSTPAPAYKYNARKNMEIEKYFFPQVIENMKKDGFWYVD